MDSMGGGHLGSPGPPHLASTLPQELIDDLARRNQVEDAHQLTEGDESRFVNEPGVSFLPSASYLCDLRHDADEAAVPAAEPGAVSRWRMKDRVSTCFFSMILNCIACADCSYEAHYCYS